MAFKAPYIPKDELRRRAGELLQDHNPAGTIPVPIEFIVESAFGMDIVPMPGLEAGFDTVAFLTKDLREIRVDEYVYFNRLNRYRFSLAHELAHRILHADLWRDFEFHDIASWKAAITQSIPEREYSYVEFHANYFAGLVCNTRTWPTSTRRRSTATSRQPGLAGRPSRRPKKLCRHSTPVLTIGRYSHAPVVRPDGGPGSPCPT